MLVQTVVTDSGSKIRASEKAYDRTVGTENDERLERLG